MILGTFWSMLASFKLRRAGRGLGVRISMSASVSVSRTAIAVVGLLQFPNFSL